MNKREEMGEVAFDVVTDLKNKGYDCVLIITDNEGNVASGTFIEEWREFLKGAVFGEPIEIVEREIQ